MRISSKRPPQIVREVGGKHDSGLGNAETLVKPKESELISM
jgi:hypothetical protein